MHYFVETNWLYENMASDNIVIIDARGCLQDLSFGKKSYDESHIPGSYFVNGETELTGEKSEHGGRHPLPDMGQFRIQVESFGITANSHVIAYGMYAARVLFMINLLKIPHTSLLNGGFEAWQQEGYPLTSDLPKKCKGNISDINDDTITASMQYVKDNISKDTIHLIDSRSPERYAGINEPIDPVAGHIPSAINYFWHDNFDEIGMLKPTSEQKERYRTLLQSDKPIVLYCGSGVTACYNYYAMKQIGMQPKIYLGSWSDWISYEDNPIVTK